MAITGVPLLTCSTGAITRWPDITDDRLLDRWCPEIDADAFEVMFYATWYAHSEDIAVRLRGLGHRYVSVHAEKDIGPDLVAERPGDKASAIDRLATNCRFARQIGADMLVLHLWGLPDGDAKLDQQLEILPQLIDIAEAEGIRLAIEAIPCTIGTPIANLERVVASDGRARIVLDTEFLSLHNELDDVLRTEWLWRYNRVLHVHVKDFDGVFVDEDGRRRYLQPGEGDIPFAAWFSALASRGYRGPITLESTVVCPDGKIDIQRLNRSLCALRNLMQSAWI